MKQTVQSEYTLELTQQEFAAILAAVFSTTEIRLVAYFKKALNDKEFGILSKEIDNLQEEFRTKNNIICSSDLIKGLLKE